MDDSSEDLEGEKLGFILPDLIEELRKVLDEYPDDGQILKVSLMNSVCVWVSVRVRESVCVSERIRFIVYDCTII